ncbi:hypothetical protein ACN47E_000873 [Coniothyrium glycines]
MDKHVPNGRVVYLACKNIFHGADASLRKRKTILARLKQNVKQGQLKKLTRDHTIEAVCDVAKTLLVQDIFSSTLKARKQFPEVFEVSLTQTAKRVLSVAKAAEDDKAAIQLVTEPCKDELQDTQGKPTACPEASEAHKRDSVVVANRCSAQMPMREAGSTSLYPVYLPFAVQHRLLVKLQATAEAACYDFAKRTEIDVLEQQGWDCEEAGELCCWRPVLERHQSKFDPKLLEKLGKPLPILLAFMSQLRNAAVHRARLTSTQILESVTDAEVLIILMGNNDYIHTLSVIRKKLQETIGELEKNKYFLELHLAERRKYFAARREELELEELEEVESVFRRDKDFAIFAGRSLEDALNVPATVIHSEASTDDGLSSDTDFDSHSAEEAGPSGKHLG